MKDKNQGVHLLAMNSITMKQLLIVIIVITEVSVFLLLLSFKADTIKEDLLNKAKNNYK